MIFIQFLLKDSKMGAKGEVPSLQAKMSKYFQIVYTQQVLAKGYQAASGLSN